jgi:glycosyltransferase involved in cell wall biosynthesis
MTRSIVVIMPVRDGLAFLPGAIECVKAQAYSPLELVIVDDGSSDGSFEYAKQAGLRTLQTPGSGPAAARNAGIRATASDFVAFLDVDDFWPPGTLPLLSEALVSDPEAGFAQGLIQNFRVLPDGSPRFFKAPYRFLNLGAALYRRGLFDAVGLLDETMRLSEDLDFLMRCWEKDVRRVTVDSVTLHYRRHAGSMTAGLEGAGFGTVQAYKRRIDRARRGEYDPNQPRQVPAIEYLGAGPGKQDEETLP